jgi:hypothetical protein
MPDQVKHTERTMLDALHQRYNQKNGDSRRYAVIEHPCETGYFGRIADALVMDCWPSGGNEFHGFEIKVSRSDWLHELKDPLKAEAFKKYMDRWWLVTPTKDIVKPGELPPGWGHLTLSGTGWLRAAVPAPRLTPLEIPRRTLTYIMRATAATAARQTAIHPELYLGYYDTNYHKIKEAISV